MVRFGIQCGKSGVIRPCRSGSPLKALYQACFFLVKSLEFRQQRIGFTWLASAVDRFEALQNPWSRGRRQVVGFDAYSPSLRKSLTGPSGSVQLSAKRRMRRLYSAGNLLLLAFSGTSGSGVASALPAPSGSLRSPSVASGALGGEQRSLIGRAFFMNVVSPQPRH
jgi:hypothetical protein